MTSTIASCAVSTVGATVGGAIFGSIVTAAVFVCFHHKSTILAKLKRNHAPDNSPAIRLNNESHKEPREQVGTSHAVYSVVNNEAATVRGFNEQQHQEELSKMDDLYNHLHESEKADSGGNYDQAVLANVVEGGYGMASVNKKSNDYYCEVNPTPRPEDGISWDPGYEHKNQQFTLEHQ